MTRETILTIAAALTIALYAGWFGAKVAANVAITIHQAEAY